MNQNTPSIQFASFPDGGFVLHKITLASLSGRISAWFDKSGTLLECEQIRENGASYPVKCANRDAVAAIGRRYVKA